MAGAVTKRSLTERRAGCVRCVRMHLVIVALGWGVDFETGLNLLVDR